MRRLPRTVVYDTIYSARVVHRPARRRDMLMIRPVVHYSARCAIAPPDGAPRASATRRDKR